MECRDSQIFLFIIWCFSGSFREFVVHCLLHLCSQLYLSRPLALFADSPSEIFTPSFVWLGFTGVFSSMKTSWTTADLVDIFNTFISSHVLFTMFDLRFTHAPKMVQLNMQIWAVLPQFTVLLRTTIVISSSYYTLVHMCWRHTVVSLCICVCVCICISVTRIFRRSLKPSTGKCNTGTAR